MTMLSIILSVFVFCFVLERLVPGWRLPRVRTWPFRVLAINAVQLGVVLVAGVLAASVAATSLCSPRKETAVGGMDGRFDE
jgi:multisubunit Na+/H+ antiporter MnhF subunit